ncbi:branched-chain amino acid transporter permease [Parablautia muri]|uniref:Branched-chain amino acid transporter AzlD n=1 Tax=Parablautia muri TaxID=2320879 RepID=A0A9X5GSA8_9FIRM|nr:AzlD domain-containing protein [Parablautia muri]NBJ93069.1 branched-chain amino acid transporter AzlD [Parablautia muri]
MHSIHSRLVVVVTALVTLLLRGLPFLVFGGKKKTSAFIQYLSEVLPYAIIGMLVVYCLRGVQLLAAPHGLPEILGVGAVVLLHLWKRNTLLSIALGTIIYMLLVQVVFRV